MSHTQVGNIVIRAEMASDANEAGGDIGDCCLTVVLADADGSQTFAVTGGFGEIKALLRKIEQEVDLVYIACMQKHLDRAGLGSAVRF